jgi:hypothetical protein
MWQTFFAVITCGAGMKERKVDMSRFRPESWLGRAACIRLETMAGGGEVRAAVSPEEKQNSALNKSHLFLRTGQNSQLTERHTIHSAEQVT